MNAPVCHTLMGKGAYDGTSDNYTGMLGMHGTKDLKPWSFRVRPFDCDWYTFLDRVLGNPKKFADQAKILQFDVARSRD